MVFIKCIDVVGKVSEVIDQEASLMTSVRFYGHLMMCSNCRRYFKQFKVVKEAAGTVIPGDLPDDFDRVMDFVLKAVKKRDGKDV